jgi:hypothetical protein
MIALLHFTCKNLETYHVRRLLAFAGSRRSQPQLVYNALLQKAQNLNVTKISEYEYHVESSTESSLVYEVYTDIEQCTCVEGIGGKYCKHLCAIQVKYDLEMSHCPLLSPHDKKQLATLALGSENIDLSFFESMQSDRQDHTENSLSNIDTNHIIVDSNNESQSVEPMLENNEDSNISEALDNLSTHFLRLSKLASS